MSDQIKQTLAAGQSIRIERSANVFLLAEAGAPVEVALYRHGNEFLNIAEAGAGYKFSSADGMTAARVTNNTAAAVDVQFFVVNGDTEIQVGDANALRGALTTEAHTVTNADGQLLAADLKRDYLEIQNNHATDAIYIKTGAGAATTTNTIKIKAGGSYWFGRAPTNEVRAIGDAIANTQVIVMRG